MEKFTEIIEKIDGYVWGIPLVVLILGCGVWLTVRTGGIQFRRLGTALKLMFSKEGSGTGEVSSFAALCTALSATIGTGNIVGVATAIAAGGAGALFWMEIAAIFGMATKYSEGLLAIKYRIKDKNGQMLGGPFYYIEKGMGAKWKWLAKIFAVFGVFVGIMGIGTITQINGITSAANNFFDPEEAHTLTVFGNEYTYATIISGVIVTIFTALIIIGGIKRISSVSSVVVPFMAVAYILCCLFIILSHATEIPAAVVSIVKSAFGIKAAAGGAVGVVTKSVADSVFKSMQSGISRGIFSNEAGLGSAPIAAAAAKSDSTVKQGLVTMTGTFIDTIVVCTMTGLAIVISDCINTNPELEGVEITTAAFQYGLPFPDRISSLILMACLMFFAFTTILGWNYYSERCLAYLTKSRRGVTLIFRILYIAAIFIGPYLTVSAVWTIADIFNGLMAVPNIIALLALSGVVAAETKDYLKKEKES